MPIRAKDIASAVLDAVGGRANVVANSTCMTRLRITLVDTSLIDFDTLDNLDAVLGCTERGVNGIEVVFGPKMIRPVFEAFSRETGIAEGIEPLIGSRRPNERFTVHVGPASSGTQKAKRGNTPAVPRVKVTQTPQRSQAAPVASAAADKDDVELLTRLADLYDSPDE